MRHYLSPPATEEGKEFYTRYASLVPKLRLPGYLAQVVSGLTEWGILYALIYASLAAFWPEAATSAGMVGATIGVTIIEGGLRGLLPFSARAIIKKRWEGLDGWISWIVLAITALLLAASAFLSFAGSRSLVAAMATAPTAHTSTIPDSLATTETDVTNASWQSDIEAIQAAYSTRMEAVKIATAATIRRLDATTSTLAARERATGQFFTTARSEVRQQVEDAKADRDTELAKLSTSREAELATLRAKYRGRLEGIAEGRDATRHQVATSNVSAAKDHQAKIGAYGGSLAWFTILCLIVLIVSVTVEELHRAGAGIEERSEPDAYTFEGSALTAFRRSVSERFQRWLFGIVHHIERGTPEAPEPVAAAVIWQRANVLNVATSRKGIVRKLKPLKPLEGVENTPAEPERRQVGFTRSATSEPPIPPCTLYSPPTTNHQPPTTSHETPGMREVKQRLKRYKKRLGEHTQKAIIQQRKGGEVRPRTAEAIVNNEQWIGHYQAVLKGLNPE